MSKPNFEVENLGTIALIKPLNKRAKQWIKDNLQHESWQEWCGSLAVEPRYIDEILWQAEEDGL